MYKTKYGIDVSISISIDENDLTTKRLTIHAPLYINKQWSPGLCFCSSFTDKQILADPDLNELLSSAYGIN